MKCDRQLTPVDGTICDFRIEREVSDEFRETVRGVKPICTDVKLIAEGEQQLIGAVGYRVDRSFLPWTDDERKNLSLCLKVDELRDRTTGSAIIHRQLALETAFGISVEKDFVVFRNKCRAAWHRRRCRIGVRCTLSDWRNRGRRRIAGDRKDD